MDEGKRDFRGLSWRYLFFLSLTLNVGFFFSSFSYERTEGFREGKRILQEQGKACTVSAEAHVVNHDSSSSSSSSPSEDAVVNLDHGDPTMYEAFWQKMGDRSSILISGWQGTSYFSDSKNLCWFLEPEFAKQVKRLHKLVGNAKTEDRHIVVGTGSTQLYQALLYALSPPDTTDPISVVSSAPFYSSYPLQTDFLKSRLYKWAGDAYTFDKEGPYIELVCSPNNPDGYSKGAVVNRKGGTLVHDLAYYWPQYTPITYVADHDLMLFTVSKCTGHAGMRIGWALVKDIQIAKRMTKFIELNTIGVSKDSQLRSAKILQTVSDSCERVNTSGHTECIFKYGRRLMTERWEKLRKAVRQNGMFSVPEFSSDFCNHTEEITEPHPGFAWLKCEGEVEDCEGFLRSHKIITRSGKHFGGDTRVVRVSMLDRDSTFELFVKRLSSIRS